MSRNVLTFNQKLFVFMLASLLFAIIWIARGLANGFPILLVALDMLFSSPLIIVYIVFLFILSRPALSALRASFCFFPLLYFFQLHSADNFLMLRRDGVDIFVNGEITDEGTWFYMRLYVFYAFSFLIFNLVAVAALRRLRQKNPGGRSFRQARPSYLRSEAGCRHPDAQLPLYSPAHARIYPRSIGRLDDMATLRP